MDTDAVGALPSRTPGPLQRAMSRERERAVQAALAELPEMYQAVIRMHYWLGASVDEIAEYMGSRPGTVKSYLFRARARLHAKLEEKGYRHE
jgi:RNA polymerase sigma factor (sigma-70 family)